MKTKYTQPLRLTPENGDWGLYFTAEAYDIEPLNMDKRVRVFINQLLPDIIDEAKTIEGYMFAYIEIAKLGFTFIARLEKECLYDEGVMVQKAMHVAVSELSNRFGELKQWEQSSQ